MFRQYQDDLIIKINSPKLEIKLAHTKTTTVLKILTILCGRFKLKAKMNYISILEIQQKIIEHSGR